MAKLERNTRETQIRLDVRPGSGRAEVSTTEPFLDHMLVTLARYSGLDIELEATGDLRHHLIEDIGIALGIALREEVPETATRYGTSVIPMDDALVAATIDIGGRAWYEGTLPSDLYQHFLQSFATNLAATLHIEVRRGTDRHHVVEAAVKATGMALRQALADSGTGAVFSTKGRVELQSESEFDEGDLDEEDL